MDWAEVALHRSPSARDGGPSNVRQGVASRRARAPQAGHYGRSTIRTCRDAGARWSRGRARVSSELLIGISSQLLSPRPGGTAALLSRYAGQKLAREEEPADESPVEEPKAEISAQDTQEKYISMKKSSGKDRQGELPDALSGATSDAGHQGQRPRPGRPRNRGFQVPCGSPFTDTEAAARLQYAIRRRWILN